MSHAARASSKKRSDVLNYLVFDLFAVLVGIAIKFRPVVVVMN